MGLAASDALLPSGVLSFTVVLGRSLQASLTVTATGAVRRAATSTGRAHLQLPCQLIYHAL